jgi:phosphate transport system permease protein
MLDRLFPAIGAAATGFGLFMLSALLIHILVEGLPRLDWQFLTSFPSRRAGQAGIYAAWVGTLWVMGLTAILSLPLGIAAAVYMEEYAEKNILTSFIEINIANLVGVPSIIYGLLGLGLFVRWLQLDRSLLAGALTLSLLVIPMVILSSREALSAVPRSIREASWALGASQWQTIRHQILPAAMPGVLTGVILAMSRAIGETAPLVTIGAVTYVSFLPGSGIFAEFPKIDLACVLDPFSALPVQIFNWISRPQKAFSENAAAGIIVLLAIMFLMNGVSVYLRHRYRRHIRW